MDKTDKGMGHASTTWMCFLRARKRPAVEPGRPGIFVYASRLGSDSDFMCHCEFHGSHYRFPSPDISPVNTGGCASTALMA